MACLATLRAGSAHAEQNRRLPRRAPGMHAHTGLTAVRPGIKRRSSEPRMKDAGIKKQLLLFTLIPAAAIAVLLASYFTYTRWAAQASVGQRVTLK